jgi:hypothetical protein
VYHWLKNLKESPFFLQRIYVFSLIFRIVEDYSLQQHDPADLFNRYAVFSER